jgi:hypothetical protein
VTVTGPGDTPHTTPVELTVAILVDDVLHVPPGGVPIIVVKPPTHMAFTVLVITALSTFTFIVLVAVHCLISDISSSAKQLKFNARLRFVI